MQRQLKQKISRSSALTYVIASALSFATFLISYYPFSWLLVRYQTWRVGHPNPFVIGLDLDAMLCSLLAGVVVFWLFVWKSKRGDKID